MMLTLLGALVAYTSAAQPSATQPTPITQPYAEVSQSALLAHILPKLKRSVRDPYSIRDSTLCSPRGLKLLNGRADRWSVFFSFNAKNAMGGYVGIETWLAVFRQGRLFGQLIPTQIQGTDGLMGLINRKLQRELETCTPVSDEQIQSLMGGGQVRP